MSPDFIGRVADSATVSKMDSSKLSDEESTCPVSMTNSSSGNGDSESNDMKDIEDSALSDSMGIRSKNSCDEDEDAMKSYDDIRLAVFTRRMKPVFILARSYCLFSQIDSNCETALHNTCCI